MRLLLTAAAVWTGLVIAAWRLDVYDRLMAVVGRMRPRPEGQPAP